jgi:hypothetical protein
MVASITAVWVIVTMGKEKLEIKWRLQELSTVIRLWRKGFMTKCVRCRDRQKEKYLQKEGDLLSEAKNVSGRKEGRRMS